MGAEVYSALVLERASTGDRRRAATVRALPVASTRLPAHPGSSRAGRAFLAEHLHDWGLDGVVDDATLLVSEVMTAAILHVRSPVDLTVRKMKTAVRVEVFDDGQRSPRPVDPDFETAGMNLVEAVATRWGIDETEAGQTVWFEIAL